MLRHILLLRIATSTLAQVPTLLNGNVFDGAGGPLLSGHVYHIVSTGAACGIAVPGGQTLTIQPGAIIKVGGCWVISGNVQAIGTAGAPIFITSIHDDARGGDTNQNGNQTAPQRGDWSAIDCLGDGSRFEHCRFLFGGRNGGANFAVRSRVFTFRHCRFASGAGPGLTEAGNAICHDNDFDDLLGLPVTHLALATLSGFTDNRAQNCVAGDYALIQAGHLWPADLPMDHRHSMNGNGVFVLDCRGPLTVAVAAGRTWTLPAGTILKMATGLLQSAGRIVTQGLQGGGPVVLTSLRDDSHGGDTNKDGNATAPTPGDWSGVEFRAGDTSTIDGTLIRFGGAANDEAVNISGSSVRVTASIIERSAGAGLRFGSLGTPRAGLRTCGIFDCVGPAMAGIRWTELATCGDLTFAGNAFDHVQVAGEDFTASIAIPLDAVPGGVLESLGGAIVRGQLTLPAGLVVKSANGAQLQTFATGRITCLGTARRPIVLTSIHDDTIGGDSNKNGNATLPAPGQGPRIALINGGISTLQSVELRYPPHQAVWTDGAAAHVLRGVQVRHGAGDGIRLFNVGVADDLLVHHCGLGIDLGGGSFALRHATVADNTGIGIRRASAAWTGTVRNCIAWNNAGGNLAGLVAAQVFGSNGGFAGSNGNRNVDPRFVGTPLFDYRLQPTSPCIDAADPATALAVGRDLADAPRALDPLGGSAMLPDMGAFERPLFSLAATGVPRAGTTMTFAGQGPPGIALLALGLDDGPPVWLPPYGALLVGATAGLQAVLPIGSAWSFTVPGGGGFVGQSFAVQALCLAGGQGGLTAVDRNVLAP